MEIEKFSVRELTTQEQLIVNGGGKLGEFLAEVWEGIKDVAEWLWEHVTFSIEYKSGNFDAKATVNPGS
jgi:hypothetical protein